MKVQVEIITGFLGSGKTSFIKSLIKESYVENERIIVIQLENGQSKINEEVFKYGVVTTHKESNLENLRINMIKLIEKYLPNRIIIEFNGTCNLEEMFKMFDEKPYRSCLSIDRIYFIANVENVKSYIKNMGNLLIPFIELSSLIILNNTKNFNEKELYSIKALMKNINPSAYILDAKSKSDFNSMIKESEILENIFIRKLRVKFSNSKRYFKEKKE